MTNPIELMQEIIADYSNDPKWINAPLGSIKSLSNTHIGGIGQDFVKKWCRVLNLHWVGADTRTGPWDAKIQGVTFEIKTATEDVSGNFQFNHIRHHRPYQALLCLGIAPDIILFHAWRKGDVVEGHAGHLVTMDKGSSATFKLTKKPDDLIPLAGFELHIGQLITEITAI